MGAGRNRRQSLACRKQGRIPEAVGDVVAGYSYSREAFRFLVWVFVGVEGRVGWASQRKGGCMGGLNGSAFHAPDMEYHSCWGGRGESSYHARALQQIGDRENKETHLMATRSTSCTHYSKHNI